MGLLTVCGVQAGTAPAARARGEVIRVQRAQSASLPIEVVGPNVAQNQLMLEWAERVWRLGQSQLLSLEDGKAWLRIRWVKAGEPISAASAMAYPVILRLEDGHKVWIVDVDDSDDFSRRKLARSCVSAFIMACAWDGAMPQAGQEIAQPPFWLVEGMALRHTEARRDQWAEIVSRLHRMGKLPRLAEIEQWDGPGDHPLETHLRQAVCYWLVRQALQTPVDSRTLRLWLQNRRLDPERRYWNSSEEELWWRQVAGQRLPGELPLLSWEQTAARLRESLHFPARLKGEKESRLISLLDLPARPSDLEGERPWAEIGARLTQTRAQAHWLWVFVIDKYEQALAAWVLGRTADYQRLVAEALIIQGRMDATLRGAGDLLDWVTVNFPAEGTGDDWTDLRALVAETEKIRPGTGSLPDRHRAH